MGTSKKKKKPGVPVSNARCLALTGFPDLSRYPVQGPDLRIPNDVFPFGHVYNHLTRGDHLRG